MFESDLLTGAKSNNIWLLQRGSFEKKLTCFQTKLQVVFSDNEDGHGFDKKEESKSNAEWTLPSFLQLEVVSREREKGLTVGTESRNNISKS